MLAVTQNDCVALPASMGPLRVLLVEDNKSDAELVQEYFHGDEFQGIEVFEAKVLRETLATLTRERMDAVLLDLQLPDSAGLDTLSRVQECAPELAIIVLTGRDDAELEYQAIARGAQDYILKRNLEPKTLSRALRQSVGRARVRACLTSALDECSAGIVVAGLDQRIHYANAAARALLGESRLVVGKQLPAPLLTTATTQRAALGQGDDQVPKWVEVTTTNVEWYGKSARLLCLTEATEHKRIERLQSRLERANRLATAGQLAAGVAHDVNNPATYVMGNISELTESLQELKSTLERAASEVASTGGAVPDALAHAKFDELFELCNDSASGMEKIVQIVRDLRDFSRSKPKEVSNLDINLLLRTACRMTERVVRHRAALHVDLVPTPPIVGNRCKLEQVFTNMLINAAQAIDEGAPEDNWVRVSTEVSAGTVFVRIADSGRGMSPEIVRQAYRPFFTTKPRGVGTGLGLSVSLQIVQEHGGRIGIDTMPGRGTTFELSFPIPDTLEAQGSDVSTPTATSPGHCKLLVIDDEPEVLNALLRIARKRHDAVGVGSWEEARLLLETGLKVDAILCDLMMPIWDGKRIYESVSETNPGLAPRLVFCSGGTYSQRLKEFVTSLPNERLEKPFSLNDLDSCLQRIITKGTKPPSLD